MTFWITVWWGCLWTVVVMCLLAGAHHLLIGRRKGAPTKPDPVTVSQEFWAEVEAEANEDWPAWEREVEA